jgi:hypothetical protein
MAPAVVVVLELPEEVIFLVRGQPHRQVMVVMVLL